MSHILVIDDDQDITALLKRFLIKKNYSVDTVLKAEDGLRLHTKNDYDLVLSDFRLPDMDGLDLLKSLKSSKPNVPVIIITGYSDINIAVETIKIGAFDYVSKPILPDEILSKVREALGSKTEPQHIEKEAQKTISKTNSSSTSKTQYVKGNSKLSDKIYNDIELIAPTDMTVIINGDTGTGKEYVAREIHAKSKRATKPFVAIDCGALPTDIAGSEFFGHIKGAFTGAINDKTGSFELANGGTLFLDEISNLSYDVQVKLLRALQERKIRKVGGAENISVDVRVLVASNENLKDASVNGDFREDLYHRLNEFSISIEPLRKRPEDITLFTEHFIELANKDLDKSVSGVSDEALQFLKSYAWPGNLRELKNLIKRSVLITTGDTILADSLPSEIKYQEGDMEADGGLKSVAGSAERQAIINALEETKGNKSQAAKLLNIDRRTLYNKLSTYKLK